jgi:hypothetical protein
MPKFVMSDGRMFTDYSPSCELNKNIQQKYNIQNSHEYKKFLQNNAENLITGMSKCVEGEDSKVCPVCKLEINL